MAVEMVIKIDDIKGESVADKHEGEIDCISWSWGMTQMGTAHSAQGAGAGKVDVQNLTITKYIDSASPNLIKLCCRGKAFTLATLTIRKASQPPVDYVKLELHNGIVAQVAVAGSSGDDRFTENVSLNFASFKYYYTPQEAANKKGGEIPAAWNIAKNNETVP